MFRTRRLLPAVLLLLFPLFLFPPPLKAGEPPPTGDGDAGAAADAPAGEVVDEIVVVARRREESLQKVPISVTTFDEAAIEERLMVDITDVGTFTPNVSLGTTSGYSLQTSDVWAMIRGIGQLSVDVIYDPGVGIYVDGVFLPRSTGGVLDLLDVERIEVLRGPQGTLFGKNTTGGAISILTRRPSSELVGRVSATVGSLKRRNVRGSVSGPLSQSLRASLALRSSERDGFSRSLASGQEYDDDDRQTGRLALRWAPSPAVTVDVRGDSTREREAGGHQILLALTPTPLLDFYNSTQVAAGRPPVTEERYLTDSLYESYSSGPSFGDLDHLGFSLDVDWLLKGSLSLRWLSSYRDLDNHIRGDQDTIPNVMSDTEARIVSQHVTQELQLSGRNVKDRLSWVLGGLYFREKPRSWEWIDIMADLFDQLENLPAPLVSPPGAPGFLCNPGPPPPGVPCFGGAGNPANLFFYGGFGGYNVKSLRTESWAFFGETTYELSDKLSATFGARYSLDEKWFHLTEASIFGDPRSDVVNEKDWDAVTARFSLAYQVKPEVLLYTTSGNGYKSGGFNGRPQGTGVLQPYDPEDVWSYEVGFKSDLVGRKLRLNGALFWNDYANIHFSQRVDVDNMPIFLIQNAGKAEIKGFELELEAYPLQGLNLTLALGHTDTKLVEVAPGVEVAVEQGVSLPKAPQWTASAALQYAFDLGGDALIVRADYAYTSKVYNDLSNSPTIAQEGYGLLNARLSWTPRAGAWELSGFVTNLTDEAYLAHGTVAAGFGFHLGVAGTPRQWGLTAQWRF